MQSEPVRVTSGDTWTWLVSLDDYPASAGWVLAYAMVSATAQIAITATAEGDSHRVTVAATTTDDYAPGAYSWQSYVSRSGQRFTVASGTLIVDPNLAAATAGYDTRSAAAKTLAAIETYLTTGDPVAASVRFQDRELRHHDILDLLKARDLLRAEVANEGAAAKAAQAGIDPRRYQIRMVPE